MIKKLQILTLVAGLCISSFATVYQVHIISSGSPAKASFDVSTLTVPVGDTAKITNNTTVAMSLAIPGYPFSLPLAAGASFTYPVTTAGYGTIQVTLTSSKPSTLPASTAPLIIKEPSGGKSVDTDKDGLSNFIEKQIGTDTANVDSDFDGVNDGIELGIAGFDADTLSQTNPLINDTDGGGKIDGAEDKNGNGKVDAGETNPNNSNDDNVVTSIFDNKTSSDNIYPNPAKDVLFVNETGNYKLFDISGKVVSNGEIISNKIDISSIKEGFYQLIVGDKTYKISIK